MTVRIYLCCMIPLLTGCDKQLQELSMDKVPYTGNELRIDGYYHSGLSSGSDIGLAVFYRDGLCIHMFVSPESSDTLGYLEEEILLNEEFISDMKKIPSWIGVFNINDESIAFETWEAGRNITTFSHLGEILNDSTFILKERINNDRDITFEENIIYRFKRFSPKPDSTNLFIR